MEVKVKLKYQNGNCFLVLKYDEEVLEKLEKIFRDLGLYQRQVLNGFGKGIPLKIWGSEEYEEQFKKQFIQYIKDKTHFYVIDNINACFIDGDYFNLAIFRIIPDENFEVKILLDKFVDILELRRIIEFISFVLEAILNIVIQKEVKISISEEK